MLLGDSYWHTAVEGLITGAVGYLGKSGITWAVRTTITLFKSTIKRAKTKKRKPKT